MGIGDVTTKEARKLKDKLCGMVNDTDMNVSLDTLSSVTDVVDVVWIKNSASMALGLYSGLLSFQRLLPVALSVAPGLLTAALRIKVVAPQSYLPGVFIVLMPLMYMPMVWSCGVCAVQSIGEIRLLVSLAFLAFSPALYTVFGIRRAVTSPIPRTGVLDFFQTVKNWTWMCYLVALFFFVWYMVKICTQIHEIEERKGLGAFVLEQARKLLLPLVLGEVTNLVSLLLSRVVWSMLFTFATEMFLTTVVSADWMLHSSAEEYDYAVNAENWALVEMQEEHVKDADVKKLHGDLEAARMAMLEITDLGTKGAATPDPPQSYTAVIDAEQPLPPPQHTLNLGTTATRHRGGLSFGR